MTGSNRKRVVIMRVGGEPEIRDIDPTLAAMQAIVGGLIEPVHMSSGIDLVLNEEGLITDLPLNREVRTAIGVLPVHGDAFFGRWDPRTGDLDDLTLADILKIMAAIS